MLNQHKGQKSAITGMKDVSEFTCLLWGNVRRISEWLNTNVMQCEYRWKEKLFKLHLQCIKLSTCDDL